MRPITTEPTGLARHTLTDTPVFGARAHRAKAYKSKAAKFIVPFNINYPYETNPRAPLGNETGVCCRRLRVLDCRSDRQGAVGLRLGLQCRRAHALCHVRVYWFTSQGCVCVERRRCGSNSFLYGLSHCRYGAEGYKDVSISASTLPRDSSRTLLLPRRQGGCAN